MRCLVLLAIAAVLPAASRREAPEFDPAIVNQQDLAGPLRSGAAGSAVLRAQILLGRARFSCGELDGVFNPNTRNAVLAFQKRAGLRADGRIGADTWRALNHDASPALAPYTITPEDLAGPFVKVPEDMMQKAELPALYYESAQEALAERFHVNPQLLARLNPDKRFDRPGETILAPNIPPPPGVKAASILIQASTRSVEALDDEGKVLAHYPASIGSEHDPLPVGSWKVLGVKRDPIFHYNPDLFWDRDESHSKATIAAGPNNPVGVVWVALSKPHYGIHGTPEPSSIGRTQSHGCIRLTNWDAAELADMVAPGTPAILRK